MSWLLFLISAPGAGAASESLSNTADVPIAASGAWVSSPIAASGLPAGARVTGVDVSFSCIHPNAGELEVELRADSGGLLGFETLWSLEGEGTSDPSRSLTGITTFNGLAAERTWYLAARDGVPGNLGSIDEWALTLYYQVPSDIIVQGIPGITPNPVAAGQSIVVSYTIRNDGPADAVATQTKIQIKDSAGIQLTKATFAEPAIAAGGTMDRVAEVPIPVGTLGGSYTVYVILDNLSALYQPSPSNDVAPGVGFTVDGSPCDVVVEGTPQVSPNAVTAGQSITVSYAIHNHGPADAGETQTTIEIRDSYGTVITAPAFATPDIPVGGTSNETAVVSIPAGTPPGTYTARVLLDGLGQLSQTSAVNDLAAPVLFAVTASASEANGPDLAAAGAPAVSPPVIVPGGTLTVDFEVENLGGEASLPTSVTVEMLGMWGGTVASQTVVIGALPADSVLGPLAVALQVPALTPSGSYFVRYVINAAGQRQSNYCNDFSPPQPVQVTPSGPVAAEQLVEGIDVSRHEGVIDWAHVRAAGKEFAYIKATEGGTVAGFEAHPAFFADNWPQAVAAGVVVGAYHFSTPLRSPPWHDAAWSEPAADAREEAARFVETAMPTLQPGFLPPGLDVEPHAVSYVWNELTLSYDVDPAVGFLDPLDLMGAEALARWILDWCMEVERLSGVRPVIYMTKSYAEVLGPYLGDRYNYWIAAISDPIGEPDSSSWGSWLVHQYDWFGTISPGIDDPVDLNVMQGPLSDRVIQNPRLVSRGRFEVGGGRVCIEVAGTRAQHVPIQGSTDLQSWFDIGEIQMVNGCGELLYPTGSMPKHYFRIGPLGTPPW